MSDPVRRSWWRRNRWGVLALPVALVAALGGNASRVSTFYLDADLREPLVAQQGEWTDVVAVSLERDGTVEHPARVRLSGIVAATAWWGSDDPLVVPVGAQAVAVNLDVAAGPEADLSACTLELVDADGTRYAYDSSITGTVQSQPCLLPDAPGYISDPFSDVAPVAPVPARPARWSTSPVVVLPAGVLVTEVRLSWAPPDYLAVQVPR